ncbi:toll/interleukin-1 receptor domain-containing protein [Trinickia terrae]|uniref:Toll/interleukin-1 receptor domain-containing protein n=1 Tax=Trinickia terrae TaxID=2571161 RepID=A0A4U1IDI1_9BURK|nr:toll/interleukin-1 receptor domain-containing protein [Trinickia terrae]TKC91702.1 toll/interleukin-1 receptor domain-containing protein [Trinickia terrae]
MATRQKTKKAKPGTFADRFLARLRELTNEDRDMIPNKTLRESLGWDDDRYQRVKRNLVDQQLVKVGQGHSGLIGLSGPLTEPESPEPTQDAEIRPLTLFLSYSHADEQLKNELLKHLVPLQRIGLINAWHDRKLKAGDDIDHEILTQMRKADIALFLISVDFINSAYCHDVELSEALAMHSRGEVTLIPVVLRSCLWQHTALKELLALPRDGKAVKSWPDQDEALASVAEGIRLKAIELQQEKQHSLGRA